MNIKFKSYNDLIGSGYTLSSSTGEKIRRPNGKIYALYEVTKERSELQRFTNGVKAIFKTVLTFGIGLAFSSIRESIGLAWSKLEKKKITRFYVDESSLPETIQRSQRLFQNTLNPSPSPSPLPSPLITDRDNFPSSQPSLDGRTSLTSDGMAVSDVLEDLPRPADFALTNCNESSKEIYQQLLSKEPQKVTNWLKQLNALAIANSNLINQSRANAHLLAIFEGMDDHQLSLYLSPLLEQNHQSKNWGVSHFNSAWVTSFFVSLSVDRFQILLQSLPPSKLPSLIESLNELDRASKETKMELILNKILHSNPDDISVFIPLFDNPLTTDYVRAFLKSHPTQLKLLIESKGEQAFLRSLRFCETEERLQFLNAVLKLTSGSSVEILSQKLKMATHYYEQIRVDLCLLQILKVFHNPLLGNEEKEQAFQSILKLLDSTDEQQAEFNLQRTNLCMQALRILSHPDRTREEKMAALNEGVSTLKALRKSINRNSNGSDKGECEAVIDDLKDLYKSENDWNLLATKVAS